MLYINLLVIKYIINYFFIIKIYGDWGLGIGDWGLGIGPIPQSPIPNPQSPIPINFYYFKIIDFIKKPFIKY